MARSQKENSPEATDPQKGSGPVDGEWESRLQRLERQVEDINLSAAFQAQEVQTTRARMQKLEEEFRKAVGVSPKDLEEVSGRLEERLEKLEETGAETARRQDLEELRQRMEELSSRLDGAAEAWKEGLSRELTALKNSTADNLAGLRKELTGTAQELRSELAETAAGERLERITSSLGELEKRLEERASTGELAEVRQAVEDLRSAVSDTEGLGRRAREAIEQVAELESRIREVEQRFGELGHRTEEAASQVEGHLDRLELAYKLVDQIEEKVRRLSPYLDDTLEGIDVDDVPAPEGELGFELADLLQVMIKHGASDLHLKVGTPPTVRLDGELIPVGTHVLTEKDTRTLVFSALTRRQRRQLLTRKGLDLAYAIPGARFRINAFFERGYISAAFRMLRTEMPSIEELGLPAVLKKLCGLNNGMILVTGPAGAGKSTTLAAMIDYINTNRKVHVVTIEDPIEFYHKDKLSLITQREVGTDTVSFAEGLRMALRQDPNVVMVGEMRDPETIMTAVMAAETGHLVFSTLHTPNCIQAIDRVLDSFSGEAQRQVRLLLANSLRAVISQRLLVRADEKGRVPATEVMIVTPTIASLILEGNTQDIYTYIQQGASEGMQTFTQSLTRLYEAGLITKEEALHHADQPTEFRLEVEGHVTDHTASITDDTLMNWL